MIRLSLLLPSVILTTVSLTSAAEDFYASVERFFDTHCYECHDDRSEKGGLDLYAISTDLSDPAALEQWIRIYDRVAHGEMPPKDQPAPSTGEKRLFSEFLSPSLTSAHEAEKGTVLRRLNRREYENTLNDLLGIHVNFSEEFPEDSRSQEFDNVGSALSISMVHLQKYLNTADKALEAAIASTTAPPEVTTKKASYHEMSGSEKFYTKQWLRASDGATVFFQAHGYPTGLLKGANTDTTGWHRIRVTGYAYQSDKPITFSVGSTSYTRGSDKPTYGYFSFPPGQPTTVELTVWMDQRYMVVVTPQGLYDPERIAFNEGIKNFKGPGLAINHIEIEGPITSDFPTKGHRLIFEGLKREVVETGNPKDKTKSWYVPQFEIQTEDATNDAAQALQRFASAAFRRPVDRDSIAPYLILFQSEMYNGESFERALRTAMTGILCSTDFLYLMESAGPLDDYEIASRLSYFLTRSAPDSELLNAASNQNLASSPDILQQQADRLLNGEHFDRFITDFTDTWLDLREMEFTNPDNQLFPEFDRYLQHSMVDETRAFVRHLIEKNLDIENVVKSDFAMLNWRLANHYGIDGVDHVEVEPVALSPGTPRGGLLSQGAILKVSANGTNTSPVLRGVWVNERILGKHPAPPPPGVPGVEPDIRGAETLREILDKHRDSENCQACHTMIDPPGFALENFNPVGGWRDHFRTIGGEGEKPELRYAGNKPVRYRIGLEVDSSGQLEDGRPFTGFTEFRDFIAEDRDQLARALVVKLLTFGTGREMGFSDRPEIDQIVRSSAEKGHGVRDLLLLTVASDIFRHK